MTTPKAPGVPEYVWVNAIGEVIAHPPKYTPPSEWAPPSEWVRCKLVPAPEPLKWEGEVVWIINKQNMLEPHSESEPWIQANMKEKLRNKRTRLLIEEIPDEK